MALTDTDTIFIPADAIAYIEQKETAAGVYLSKFEIIEFFFDWIREQPKTTQVDFLRKAISD